MNLHQVGKRASNTPENSYKHEL